MNNDNTNEESIVDELYGIVRNCEMSLDENRDERRTQQIQYDETHPVLEIEIINDEDAGVYIARNDSIGLVLESSSIDELMDRVKIAAPELAHENRIKYAELAWVGRNHSKT